MLNKEQAKVKLKSLVLDFKNNPDYYKKLSEADVEGKLVNELFVNILGWDKKDYEKRAKARSGWRQGKPTCWRLCFFAKCRRVLSSNFSLFFFWKNYKMDDKIVYNDVSFP